MLIGRDGIALCIMALFQAIRQKECLLRINERLGRAAAELPQTDWLMITWGTAWVYSLKENGKVVGNCHKQPDKLFTRRLLSVEEIVVEYFDLLKMLQELNPNLKVLFTVSPIRHAKDGMHGNQISKSTLLLAIDTLQHHYPMCHYFPSYEIMMDELRMITAFMRMICFILRPWLYLIYGSVSEILISAVRHGR